MLSIFRSAADCGRVYTFPAIWAAIFVAGVSGREPLPAVDASSFLSFTIGDDQAASPNQPVFLALAAQPPSLTFVRHDIEPDEATPSGAREASGGHGRFAAT